MEGTKTGYSSLNWKAAIDELTRGRNLASQLGAILEDASPTLSMNRDLLRKISDSFSRALTVLDTTGVVKSEDTQSSENTKLPGEKRKMESGRGGYRRRIHNNSSSSVTTTTLNDGYSWRKYGQKAILNSKSPRGYYRCTHKNDQMCLATRHVQQSEENPSHFVITYIGEHTCRELAETLQASLENDPCIIDFSRSLANTTASSNPAPSLAMKQESDEDVVSSALVSSSSGYSAVPELDTLDESATRLEEELKGVGASDHGDVTSCLQPPSVDDLGWNLGDEYSFDINFIFDYNQGGTLY
nr:WRKY70 transcription factor [Iris laevigata]